MFPLNKKKTSLQILYLDSFTRFENETCHAILCLRMLVAFIFLSVFGCSIVSFCIIPSLVCDGTCCQSRFLLFSGYNS